MCLKDLVRFNRTVFRNAKTDVGIYRDGTWSIKKSSDGGHTLVNWGRAASGYSSVGAVKGGVAATSTKN
jgi:hypothetical protein